MKQPVNTFRYTVTNRLGVLQQKPLGESNFTIEWEREDEGRLDYKSTLPSKIVFNGQAFANLLKIEQSIYRCDFNTIEVERMCVSAGAEVWAPWFSGRMSFNDGSWDLDRCEVEIKLDDIKEEQCFEDNKTKEINVFTGIFTRRTIFLNPTNITIETVSHTVTGDESSDVCDGAHHAPIDDTYTNFYFRFSVDDDGAGHKLCEVFSKWAREVVIVACGDPSPGPEWTLALDTCPGGDKKYVRPARIYNCKYTLPEYGGGIQITEYSCSVIGDSAVNFTIDNGLPFEDVISQFIDTFCPGFTLISNFFQINPDVVTDINYVTGQKSKTNFLTLFQKSDVKRPTVTGNATKANLTFEKLMTGLVEIFNVRWRVDTGNIIRLEHVSFFQKNAGLNLTQPRWAKYMVDTRKYSYKNEDIPAREEYKFMEAGFGDFAGVPIIYSGGCVSKASRSNIKTHTAEAFTTDMELCLSNPDPDSKVVSDAGFVMVACEFDGVNYFVITESPILGGSTLNNSLAWAQLHRDYHKFDRPLSKGNMNNIDTLFLSVKPTKQGSKITVPLCCGDVFNPDDTIKTFLGDGVVDKATYNFKDETLEVDLLYPADLNLTTNVAPVAVNDVVFTYQDVPLLITVLTNDSDVDGTLEGIEIIVTAAHGTALITPDKKINYTPEPGYFGDDNIVYRVFDDWGEPSNNALISITVRAPNVGPNAVDDSYIAQKNTALSVPPSSGLFINDSDDVSFSLDSYDAASVQGGTVVVDASGSFTYTPPTGYIGPDSFQYTIIDGPGLRDTATVNIDVRDPDNPVANNDTYTTRRNTNLVVSAPGLLANDTTAVGVLVTTAGTFATVQGGSVTIAADGSFVYSPPTGYTGPDSFTYTAGNGTGTDTATATINVLPDVFIKLVRTASHHENIYDLCGEPPATQFVGEHNIGDFVAFFYSNSAGTIPTDVTGLGLMLNVHVTGLNYGGGGYDYGFSIPISGTSTPVFTGEIYFGTDYDCDGAVIAYKNETYSLDPGLYTVI